MCRDFFPNISKVSSQGFSCQGPFPGTRWGRESGRFKNKRVLGFKRIWLEGPWTKFIIKGGGFKSKEWFIFTLILLGDPIWRTLVSSGSRTQINTGHDVWGCNKRSQSAWPSCWLVTYKHDTVRRCLNRERVLKHALLVSFPQVTQLMNHLYSSRQPPPPKRIA